MIAQIGRGQWFRIALVLVLFGQPAWAMDASLTNSTAQALNLWFACQLAAGLLFLILFWFRRQVLFGVLGALVLLAGAARLWITTPLWFPRLEISPGALESHIMLAMVAVQAVVTCLVLVRHRGSGLPGGILAELGVVRVLLFFVLVAGFSVSATPYIAYGHLIPYILQIGVGGVLSSLQIATLLALFLVAGPDDPLRLPVAGLAVFATLASAALAWTAFDRLPHVEDEVAYLFQARTLARGALWTTPPPEGARAALEYYLLDIQGERWFGVTAPGWPILLTGGVLVGLPWLVNPILTGLTVLLAHGIASRTVSRSRADLVALLMASSPWALATGASLMTHSTVLFMVLLGWWCLVRAGPGSTRQDVILALCAGLALGWAFVTRPLDGLIVAGLTGLWLLRRLPGGIGQVVACALGSILAGSVFLLINHAMTGNPLLTAQADYLARLWPDTANAYGFGAHVGPPEKSWGALDIWTGHSPAEAVLNALNGLAALNLELLGWTFGSLIPIWALLLWRRRLDGLDRAMLVVLLAIVGALFFYWFTGTFYIGPRYWHVTLFSFLVLAAAGLEEIAHQMPERFRGRFGNVILLLCATSLIGFLPWRGVTKYHGYDDYTGDIRRQAAAEDWGHALVIVSSEGDLGAALYLNDPFLPSGQPIFARDLGPDRNAATIAAFPTREVIYFTVPN
ncbi:hypothetical protein [Ruegeria sp. HKCCA5763]|uniref:hypothetical protein n=1 Tax=Ruegeria sp. HKCCA5763 TaxID=2682987 RepID=UPI0014897C75|nr:hypothetical protein [Ruegeria sp. HKCCA5763]